MSNSTVTMTTTDKLKSRFPDLKFVKPMRVHDHPRYKNFGIQFEPNRHEVLSKGHVKEPGRKAMLVDTVAERDTKVPLRDGLHLYADVYRPQTSDEVKVPAVICWSPYGKSSISLDMTWNRTGVPKNWASGYETFEGLDPAEWCKRGYAVVNADARGVQFSEGTYFFWGDQEAEDIHDTIDFLSKQPWCNGSVCMGGNSYLAKAQVGYASRFSHPALKAIAPWEGFTDIYRQLLRRGGMAMNNMFMKLYQWGIAGNQDVEDMEGMVKSHPLFDEYWEGKYDPVENIKVPMYVLGSFVNPFHVQGSVDTFRYGGSKQKWLRIHSTFEWYEMYDLKAMDDLQRFYDRYTKGIQNGWETDTAPLRLSLLGFESIPNIVDRSEAKYPLTRQQLKTYYLDGASGDLHDSPQTSEAVVSDAAHDLNASSSFAVRFSEYTEITGFAKVRLWMSCKEKDDMDVVVQLRKIDKSGKVLKGINFPFPVPESDAPEGETIKHYGPQGFLRASTAVSRDDKKSSSDGQEIFYKFDRMEKISPGTIVPLDITFWPMGMVFAEGEGIKLLVAGHFLSEPAVIAMKLKEADDENVGQHNIHTGGKYDSHLILPIVAGNRA